ncbi:hypothetical protein D9613_000027 [Agrocybe pediades]|uniref:F-box domain-containing protein n=1 Tax=Agrocybe pediades TaxID=84607 RepID=A0A8H4R1Y1_9AGAR|nr:hypothetical protein D9613_000027 [Agrocybe pediades]
MPCTNCNNWQSLTLSQLSYTSTCGWCGLCREMSAIETQIRFLLSTSSGSLVRYFPTLDTFQLFKSSHGPKDRTGAFRPLVLGAVCKTWRSVAWTTPQLWNQPFFDDTIFKNQGRDSLAFEWISRARTLPLELTLRIVQPPSATTITSSPFSFSESRTLEFLQGLTSSASQWKSLDLHMPLNLMDYIVRQVPSWGNIHILTLRPVKIDRPESNLHQLTVQELNINWSQVREATMENLSHEECFKVLSAAKSATKCHFHSVYELRSSSNLVLPLTHPNLRYLSLNSFQNATEKLFSVVTLPNLLQFSFAQQGFQTRFNRHNNPLFAFFQRSRPFQLQKLELLGVILDTEDLKSLLETLPAISHLHLVMPWGLRDHIIGTEFKDPFFRHLAATMLDPGTFLPRLEVLELSYDGVTMHWYGITSIVTSLYGSSDSQDLEYWRRPLKTFRFNTYMSPDEPMHPASRRRIYKLSRAGVQIIRNGDLVVV